MARISSWMPLAFGAVLIGAVVVLARVGADRVDDGLRGVSRVIPTPPDKPLDPTLDAALDALPGGEPVATVGDEEDEPRIDLEYPTERDWLFLERTLTEGGPEAQRSAAKALVVMGTMRSVVLLLDAARRPGPDADLFCLAALDVLRLQRWEDAMPALLGVVLDDAGVGPTCRSEVADRFVVAGGRDAERLATLAGHDSPAIRGFVASYLADVDPDGYRGVLDTLAHDPDPEVRARAGAPTSPLPAIPVE